MGFAKSLNLLVTRLDFDADDIFFRSPAYLGIYLKLSG